MDFQEKTWLKSLKELDRNNLYKKEFDELENTLKAIELLKPALIKNIKSGAYIDFDNYCIMVLDMQGNLVDWYKLKDEKEMKFLNGFLRSLNNEGELK